MRVWIACLVLLVSLDAQAKKRAAQVPTDAIRLKVGEFRFLPTPGLVRIAVDKPKVADVKPRFLEHPDEVVLRALAPGAATLHVWLAHEKEHVWNVTVTR